MNRECRNCASADLHDSPPSGVAPLVACGEFMRPADGVCRKWRAYNEPRGGIREGEMMATVPYSWLVRIEELEQCAKMALDERQRLRAKIEALEKSIDHIEKYGSGQDLNEGHNLRRKIEALEKHRHLFPAAGCSIAEGLTGRPIQ